MDKSNKQYGLIVSAKKTGNVAPKPKANFTKPSIFDSDNSEDETPMNKASVKGPGMSERRQARIIQEKALEEDPTVFQYDELYDEIENKREEKKKLTKSEDRKPKYIGRLLDCAKRRQIENERRRERQIQKERDAEGEEFKDKESFVTSAYRQKLEEFRQNEEQEKREEYLESIGDVTRQQNLDGFYRHLYEQKVGPKDKKNEDEVPDTTDEGKQSKSKQMKPNKERVYRKRRQSDDDAEEDVAIATKARRRQFLQSNVDADSDFSIDSSDSEDEKQEQLKQDAANVEIKVEPAEDSSKDEKKEIDSSAAGPAPKSEPKDEGDENGKDEEEASETGNRPPPVDKKLIWKKRTVGEVFDAALQRYYERKAARTG